jgi:hypothetical protein
MGVLGWAMFANRRAFEPAVELLHLGLQVRFEALRPYEPAFYGWYIALALGVFALTLTSLAYALLTHRSVDRRVDRFLASRLPKHEGAVTPREPPP